MAARTGEVADGKPETGFIKVMRDIGCGIQDENSFHYASRIAHHASEKEL
jgi:hypothetical protein